MKGHAAVPNPENLERVAHIGGEIVEDDITKTCADQESDGDVRVKGAHKIAGNGDPLFYDLVLYQEIGRCESEKVHCSVPPHCKRTDSQNLRIYSRIGDQVTSLYYEFSIPVSCFAATSE
jgi:hypothetical protein